MSQLCLQGVDDLARSATVESDGRLSVIRTTGGEQARSTQRRSF